MPDQSHADLPAPGSAALRRQLDVAAGARWREGNVVEVDPAIDPEPDLAGARSSLLVALAASGWSTTRRERFALVTASRARRGTSTRLVSATGVLDDAYVERLERMGCPVVLLAPERVACSFVVADARRAVLPGARVTGPVVRDVVGMFQRSILTAGGGLLDTGLSPALDASGHTHAALVTGSANVAVADRIARASAGEGLVEDTASRTLVAGDALVLLRLSPRALLLVDDRRTARAELERIGAAASVSRHS